MIARWIIFAAVVTVAAPMWPPPARAADSKALVEEYLASRGAVRYTVTAITANYVNASLPNRDFFEVTFLEYPVGVPIPEGLSLSNVFVVQNGTVLALVHPANLRAFFFAHLAPVRTKQQAQNAGTTWLRLTETFSQDGFYSFASPQVKVIISNARFVVIGNVAVEAGGKGNIGVKIAFAKGGVLSGLTETRAVRPGVRPICQATKLLDPDPLVRRMAEQDILVMGKSAKAYLDSQRAKASPQLKTAIDRVWKRIVDEEW
jgi:hypothetical protein